MGGIAISFPEKVAGQGDERWCSWHGAQQLMGVINSRGIFKGNTYEFRLPTRQEAEQICARGEKVLHDPETSIWTSTPCSEKGEGYYYVVSSKGTEAQLAGNNVAAVRFVIVETKTSS